MHHRIIAFVLAAAVSLGLGGCGRTARAVESMGAAMENRVESMVQTDPKTAISREQAQNIALNHAGLSAGQVQYLRTNFEYDNGRPQYEVEFHFENWEYDYEIDANTGAVLSFDKGD